MAVLGGRASSQETTLTRMLSATRTSTASAVAVQADFRVIVPVYGKNGLVSMICEYVQYIHTRRLRLWVVVYTIRSDVLIRIAIPGNLKYMIYGGGAVLQYRPINVAMASAPSKTWTQSKNVILANK